MAKEPRAAKSTKKAARKTTRKTARKTTRKAPAAKKTTMPNAAVPGVSDDDLRAAASLAQRLDRDAVGEKTRVHALAKQVGLKSRDVVAVFGEMGTPKVAQSSLSRDEVFAFLERIMPSETTDTEQPVQQPTKKSTKRAAKKAAPVEEPTPSAVDVAEEPVKAQLDEEAAAVPEAEDEKLRYRVRKNVDNEIHQIVEKVDKELADAAPEEDAPEAEESEVTEPEGPEVAEAVEDESDGDFGDYVLEITPKPENSTLTMQYAPVFIAPGVGEHADDEDGFDVEELSSEDDSEGDADRKDGKDESRGASRRRRGRRGASRGKGKQREDSTEEEGADSTDEDFTQVEEPKALRGSARLEAQRRRRAEIREEGRKRRPIVSQEEFLARRESVERTMVVRERARHDDLGRITQVGVLEDDLLVEHFVTSDAQASIIGNIYLGRVQNVLPSMEAAFIDIGTGRNGVLYAGEVNWKAAGLGGRGRRIENALRSGDQVLVQVSKDPVGHKGARLTTQISLAGRYLVYVPGGRSAGISRKLPAPERKRLKQILTNVVPGDGGAIIRTAAENVSEEAIGLDVRRLHDAWEDIQARAEEAKASKGAKPQTLYEEPPLLVKVVRDLFNEDFDQLIIDGDKAYNIIANYVQSVAPDLFGRLLKYDREGHGGQDAFERYRVDEQIQKALARKVWLPSGGTLVIDRTEAMTVVDVNTGKFTGSGGNLEETVTKNNLEAAEEIVRQMRLRDLGGMIVVDFIDMVLPENRDLVLRRLKEALGRDRTRHQVSEVTSLGLVQMTRKRLGTGLLETFSTPCECCGGRGLILHDDPVEESPEEERDSKQNRRGRGGRSDAPAKASGRGNTDDAQRDDAAEKGAAEERSEDKGKGRGRRSGGSRRRRRETPDYEGLAASVVVTDDTDDSGNTDNTAERGTQSIEDIAYAAVENAEATDDVGEWPSPLSREEEERLAAKQDEPGAAPGQPSYEEAVAEFESSPRRKRRTRGNSRSDHRPRREDFADAAAEPQQEPKQEPQRGDRNESTSARRRRRRVRRSNAEAAAPQAAKQPKTQPAKQDAPAAESAAEAGVEKKVVVTGRGRRRAVRRRVAGGAASEHVAQVKRSGQSGRGGESSGDNAADKADGAGHGASASAKRGRGRRRSTRRRG